MKNIKFIFTILILFAVVSACNKVAKSSNTETTVVAPKVERQISADGELTGATYKTTDGTIIKMTITKNSSSNERNSTITFLNGNNTLLAIQNGVIYSSNKNSLGQFYYSAKGEGVDFRFDMDASNIVFDENKPSTGLADVKVRQGEKNWNGKLDFATSEFSKVGAPALADEIPANTAKIIEPFTPVLQDVVKFYSKKSGGKINQLTIGKPIWDKLTIVGSICRAACAAAGAVAAAACTAFTCTIGVAACIAAAAAAASLCIDACPQ